MKTVVIAATSSPTTRKTLRNRECFAVKRAFRMATLALEELEMAQFNKEVSEKL